MKAFRQSLSGTGWSIAAAMLLLASCSKEPAPAPAARERVTIPMQTAALQSRAALTEAEEETIRTVDLLLFREVGAQEQLAERITVDAIDNSRHIKSFEAELPVDNDKYRIVLLANARAEVEAALTQGRIAPGQTREQVAEELAFSIDKVYDATPQIPMWGEAEEPRSFRKGDRVATIQMIRAVARLDVVLSEQVQDYFELTELHVTYYEKTGRIVPEKDAFSWELYEAISPSLPNPQTYDTWFMTGTGSVTGSERELYLCEFDNANRWPQLRTVLIIGGRIKGRGATPCYYALELITRGVDPVDILRNHLYRLRIEDIITVGFDTPQDAFKYLFPPPTRSGAANPFPAVPLVKYTLDTE